MNFALAQQWRELRNYVDPEWKLSEVELEKLGVSIGLTDSQAEKIKDAIALYPMDDESEHHWGTLTRSIKEAVIKQGKGTIHETVSRINR